MNKGLEAFEILKQDIGKCYEDEMLIVEKELERLEEIDDILNTGGGIWATNGFVDKKLKAFEIIKNKGVFVHLLQQSRNAKEYNSLMLIAFKKMAERDYKGAVEKFCLTQEEYELLKEELL